MLIYMNCHIDTCNCEWPLDKYMCNIWQQTSILDLWSSTLKETVPAMVEYKNNHSITGVWPRYTPKNLKMDSS